MKSIYCEKKEGLPLWQQHAHNMAIDQPRFEERGLVELVKGFCHFASAYRQKFDAPIGEDGVFADPMLDIARALLYLLNCGSFGQRINCGTIHSFIKDAAAAHGLKLPG